MMPLLMAGIGNEVTIRKIGGPKETRHYLNNMGFTEGAKCSVVSSANGNIIVNIRDVRVAIGSDMAKRIMI